MVRPVRNILYDYIGYMKPFFYLGKWEGLLHNSLGWYETYLSLSSRR